jgi:hypothetical protein
MPGIYKQIRGFIMHGSVGAAAAPRGSRRLRELVIVIVIMAVLTAGWPLINLAVSNNRRIAANTKLTVGPSRKDSAQVTMGPGWTMQAAETDPHLEYSLRRGGVMMSIAYIELLSRSDVDGLWRGMGQILRISRPGASLSRAVRITSAHGYPGDTGRITSRTMIGTAAVFANVPRQYAVEMVIVAPRRTPRLNLVAAQRIVRSLLFPATR